MEAKSVVVMNVILGSVSNVMILFRTWRYIDLRRAIFMCLGSVLGTPLGDYLLSILDPSIIKLIMASLVIPFSVLLLLGHSYRFKRDIAGCIIAGFMGGVLGTSTSLSGPPVVLFLLNQGLVTERFVGTLAAYFLFIAIIGIGAFSPLGMVTADLLTKTATLLPALVLGSYLGVKMLPRINELLFKRIVLSIVSVTALIIIVSVLMEL